jgi:hypothetical protein
MMATWSPLVPDASDAINKTPKIGIVDVLYLRNTVRYVVEGAGPESPSCAA